MPNYHKHWYGTLAQYNALASKDSNTLYHCSEGLIYRGSVLLATRRWGDLSGVPSTFAPSAHTHTFASLTSKPTTLQGYGITNAILLNDTIQNNNSFGGRKLYISSLDNALAAADKRFFVTATLHKKVVNGVTYPKAINAGDITLPQWEDSPIVSTISANNLFNNDYETSVIIPSDSYLKVRIDAYENENTPFPGLAYGTYFLSYYHIYSPESSSVRYHVGYVPHTVGYKTNDFIPFIGSKDAGYYIEQCNLTSNHQRTRTEFIIKGHPDHETRLSQIEWKLDRPSVAFYTPTFSVFKSNKCYDNLYVGTNTSNNISLFTDGSINLAGNLGIGVVTTTQRIDVAGAGNFSTKVITGGYNYTAQIRGVGIGADGATNGIMFYNGTGVSGRIYRNGDVLYFNRSGDTSRGFELSAAGVLTHRNNFTVTGTTSLQDFTATSGSVTSLYASSSVRVYGHETSRIILGDSLDGILILCPLGMGSANNVAGTIYITRTTGVFMTTRLDFGYSTGSSTALYNAYLEYTKGSYSPSDVWELVSFSYSGQDWVGLRRTSSNQYFYTSAHFSGENLYDGPNSLTWINSTSATGITTLNYSTSRKVFTQAVTMDSSLTVLGSASFQSVSATTFSGPLTGNVTGNVTGNAATATKLASITTTFTGTYPVTVNVNGAIYSHTGLTFTGSTKTLTATTFSGALTGNASSATILQTARKINGVDFNGSANITITANTTYTLTRGSYLTGSNFNGSANTTWAVDATSANTAGKVVARDSNGDFACRTINAATGVYSLKVVTGGHNYASQTYGLGIGTDGSNSGVIFYNGTGATGRIFRESNVLRFTRGGLTYSGFDINANGSITVQGDMTTRTSLVVGSTNGTYVQIGSARLVYDQTNNAIKVVNANNSSCNLYATGSISAFGIGSSGGSGSSYSRLDDWADYVDGLTNDYVLSAELGYDLHTRVNSLNSFRSGTSWGSSGTGYSYLSIGGTSKAMSLYGHSHSFVSLTNKPTTLGGYGITNALPSTGGTLYGSNFQILEIKRNGTYGASMMFSNNNNVLAKFGFDPTSSLVIATGDSPDAIPNMLYINGSTKQITGYGSLTVSGNIETGTSDGAYVRIGNSKFLYDSSTSGLMLLSVSGGYGALRAGSVFANNVELTSSRSMKKDIQPFKNGLDLIKSIDVVSYLYKQDADDDDRKIGFIADDTDSWLSGKSKTKYNIGNTVGALIKAVQELEKKNQELEQRLLSITNNN